MLGYARAATLASGGFAHPAGACPLNNATC
jgi:hypothetical protein